MAKQKIYSVQPRFKIGDQHGGWSLVDGIFRMGYGMDYALPPVGTEYRDMFLSAAWMNEPMLAGMFATWIEKVQTVDWKVTGGRNNVRMYAAVLSNADAGRGWSYHIGMGAQDFLVCDKGFFRELGRRTATSTVGRVYGVQHLDAARIIKHGQPGEYWIYYPELGKPITLKDDNIIQNNSMPLGRDRWRGYGYCAMSRMYDAKQLMLGYLTYYRQEIGDLPPELIAIINGLPATSVRESLDKYKRDREGRGDTVYPKVWWLGSDDPAAPVSIDIRQMTTPSKSFSWQNMTEWWAKTGALNTGEDVGEYWLLQSGESKTVQSVQAMKSRGKGVARFLQEDERRINLDIMPFGVRFEYDNTDDEQDRNRADIIAKNIGTLNTMADMGVQRQELVWTVDEIRELAVQWNAVPQDMIAEEIPAVLSSTLKELSEGVWVCDNNMREYRRPPLLRGREKDMAGRVYDWFHELYVHANGVPRHVKLEEVRM